MTSTNGPPLILLPGIIMPSALRYQLLIEALGGSARALAKDLEVYAEETPPKGYSIDHEIKGISRAADVAGFDRFHLYGHSAGGACAIAYAAAHPERVLSLALDEPASDLGPEFQEEWEGPLTEIGELPPERQLKEFMKLQLAPGVEPPTPPPGDPPPWMARRPAGIEAFTGELQRYRVNRDALRVFSRPVYYSYGSHSNPWWHRMRDRLAGIFPDFTSELYEDVHHLATSHQQHSARVAAALQQLWSRA